MKRLFGKWNSLKWHVKVTGNRIIEETTPKIPGLALFDPSIGTANLGDEIISRLGQRVLNDCFANCDTLRVPTHFLPQRDTIEKLLSYRHKIVCGTNLMTPHFEKHSLWKVPADLYGYTNTLTLAVGWGYYCDDISKASRTTYRNMLSKSGLHSVRDRYTEQKFHEMGIHNVIYTACVTLWGMTPDRCKAIPKKKARDVIATITDYSRDPQADKEMLSILLDHYETVYVWIQGREDLQYLETLVDLEKICVVERSVDAFEKVLDQGHIDYIGTRLHAGILALNHGVRSIVVAIDNRAKEMGRDVNLIMVSRDDVADELEPLIESEFETVLNIPWENIEKWKLQFQ